MTSFKTLLVALALTAAPAFAQPKAPQPPRTAAQAFAADAVVSVNGMVCDFCAQAVTKSFKRRAEVADVRVDLTAKTVSIDFRPGATLDDDTIRRIVTNAGYALVSIRRTAA